MSWGHMSSCETHDASLNQNKFDGYFYKWSDVGHNHFGCSLFSDGKYVVIWHLQKLFVGIDNEDLNIGVDINYFQEYPWP